MGDTDMIQLPLAAVMFLPCDPKDGHEIIVENVWDSGELQIKFRGNTIVKVWPEEQMLLRYGKRGNIEWWEWAFSETERHMLWAMIYPVEQG